MGWIILIGLLFWVFILFGYGVIEPQRKRAIKNAYALLQEKHPDPEMVKKAIRAFLYPTDETRELTRRLVAKLL